MEEPATSGPSAARHDGFRDHRHRFSDAGAGVRLPDSDIPGRGPPDKSQRALAAAGFVDGPEESIRFGIERSRSYLLREKRPTLSFLIFERLVRHRVPGLVVTRQHPDRVRQEHSLRNVRIMWLSHIPGKDFQEPTALGTLSKVIEMFIADNNGECVLLLDGIEYLILNNDFMPTLRFVEHINAFVMRDGAIFLLPLDPRALNEKELNLLERVPAVMKGDP